MMANVLRSAGLVRLAHAARRRSVACAMGVATLALPAAVFAFSNQTGSKQISFNGAAAQNLLGTNSFTAPSTVTCKVTADITTSTQSVNFNPSGTQVMWPLAEINGSTSFSGQGGHVAPTVLGGYFRTSATRLFTVNSGQTARFGCRVTGSGDFANSAVHGNCTVTYMCLVSQ